jgi:hypothetical protein
MAADAQLDAPLSRHVGVVADHSGLNLDRATRRGDHATELGDEPVARALDDPPAMHCDRRIDQIAAQRPEPCERSLLIRAREPAVADDIGDHDRGDLSDFGHGALTRHAIPRGSSTGAPASQEPLGKESWPERGARYVDCWFDNAVCEWPLFARVRHSMRRGESTFVQISRSINCWGPPHQPPHSQFRLNLAPAPPSRAARALPDVPRQVQRQRR